MEPVGDEERLYRRIPVKPGYVVEDVQRSVKSEAFHPHRENDATGLSLSRSRSTAHPDFLSVEQVAALGPSRHGYYVAELIAKQLREHGIALVPDPMPSDPGHMLLPQLNSNDRDLNAVKELEELLAKELVVQIHGPFPLSAS